MSTENNELVQGFIVVGVSLVGAYILQRLYMRNAEKMLERMHKERALVADAAKK